jgi:hypothetical protein
MANTSFAPGNLSQSVGLLSCAWRHKGKLVVALAAAALALLFGPPRFSTPSSLMPAANAGDEIKSAAAKDEADYIEVKLRLTTKKRDEVAKLLEEAQQKHKDLSQKIREQSPVSVADLKMRINTNEIERSSLFKEKINLETRLPSEMMMPFGVRRFIASIAATHREFRRGDVTPTIAFSRLEPTP